MKNLLLIALAGLLLTSCSPSKRLNRLLKNHPELVKTDTVWSEVTIPADTIDLEAMVPLKADTSRVNLLVDSILSVLGDRSTLNLPEEGRSTPREAITSLITRNAPTLVVWPTDTLEVEDEGIKAQISFSRDGKARFRIIDKGQTIKVPVEVNTVKAPFRVPWWWFLGGFICGYFVGKALIIPLFRRRDGH
jgi:hypothetical protein